ncbi:CHP02436-containing protein (plasmid) [Gemmatirosa kalamazoonensis]|uniref:CHP02436-containing protein n=1 Tax=Gemmatirosa kalamazoonensis TaxID=861299 RepID=W0RTW1_9BACT|nr:four helix bundle protein [Gemmatirosa kalamazoonensis]AHG93033.1 CHP02436-containing protein [Gemmatirosa kalamazoonensis]
MSRLTHHRELVVWQRAMELLKHSYDVARRLPGEERFGVAAQLRRAAVSVPSNIAEGHSRIHRAEYLNHLSMARGSLAEVETLVDACEMLRYAQPPQLADARDCADQIRRMLGAMLVKLRE